jgi:regulator of protease activity HflC (stomatin/prohibitin superfamily)
MKLETPEEIREDLLPPPGPVTQAVTIGFRAVYVATLLFGLVWLSSNVREIGADSRAVVLHFGRIARVQDAGLLLAWPRPFEQVRLLPGPDRQLSQPVAALTPVEGIAPAAKDASDSAAAIPASASPYLTADNNLVLLDATLIYRITDPRAYILSEAHIAPALDRVFRAAATEVTAAWTLNDFLVAQQSEATSQAGQSITAMRAAVRDGLLRRVNSRLEKLAAISASLGIAVDRIDMTAWLPPEAKLAFDAVLTATQKADQQVAAARTDAERRRQGAQREGDRLLSAAEATANELIVSATVDTAKITAIEKEVTPQTRDGLLLNYYRAYMSDIMSRIGSANLVGPNSGARLVLPGDRQ